MTPKRNQSVLVYSITMTFLEREYVFLDNPPTGEEGVEWEAAIESVYDEQIPEPAGTFNSDYDPRPRRFTEPPLERFVRVMFTGVE